MAMSAPLPEWWPLSTIATYAVTIITAFAIIYQLSTRKLDPREPTVIASPIPYVGHLLGMVLLGGRYVKNIGIRNRQLPIFTLPMPGSRLYIVTDPSLAAAVQRASKTLSFTPIIPVATERALGLDPATSRIVRRGLDPAGPADERGFLADIQDMVYARLGPGPYLAELTLHAARELAAELAASASASTSHSEPTDLLAWVRHLVTPATARYLYGPANPLALDPGLERSFWDFDRGLGALLLGVVPALTARSAYLGRERLAGALAAYLEAGRHEEEPGGSAVVRERVTIARRHGWTLRAAARSELSFLFAGVVNVATTAFWIVLQVFADAGLLARVRGEVDGALRRRGSGEDDDDGGEESGPRYTLRVSDLRDRCPLLVATYRECLRLGSDNYSTRAVKEDTLLANRYLLRKGAVVQVAGGVIHADAGIWGGDAAAFDPGRFLDSTKGAAGGVHPAAFRAFGGGKTLCPGRHFAMSEILGFVALVVLQFDIEAAGGSVDSEDSSRSGEEKQKRIRVPRKNDGVLPVHILEPVSPVMVRITRRRGGLASSAREDGGEGGDVLDVGFEM